MYVRDWSWRDIRIGAYAYTSKSGNIGASRRTATSMPRGPKNGMCYVEIEQVRRHRIKIYKLSTILLEGMLMLKMNAFVGITSTALRESADPTMIECQPDLRHHLHVLLRFRRGPNHHPPLFLVYVSRGTAFHH